MGCFVAASHSDEDHSVEKIYRSIYRNVEDILDDDSWATWALIGFVGIFIAAGLASLYICYTAATRSARPPAGKGKVTPKEDVSRSFTTHYARRRAKLSEATASFMA